LVAFNIGKIESVTGALSLLSGFIIEILQLLG